MGNTYFLKPVVCVAMVGVVMLTPAVVGNAAASDSAVGYATTNGAKVRVAVVTAPRPPIVDDPIPYPTRRKRQMAAYSWRHYRQLTWDLQSPKQVILHYTVSPDYSSVHNWFAANERAGGNAGTRSESPGACTHFVVDKDGTIYQQAPLTLMCRHVVGLNSQTIGIEFVEMTSATNILGRPKQVQAGLTLVRWLQSQYAIGTKDVIGHAMANKSRFFVDYEGWFNDHTDWNRGQVQVFRSQL